MPTHRPRRRVPSAPLFLAWLLLFACLPAAAAENHRLDRTVVPTFESVRLTLDPSNADYQGSVHFDLTVAGATDSLRLYARDLDVIQITLRGGAGEIPLRSTKGPAGLLILKVSAPLAPGPYGLDIHFGNDFDTKANGLYRLQVNGQWYAFTQFEAEAAREAFPCWDEPEFKIPFQLTVRTPATNDVVSNTPIESSSSIGGEKTVVFKRTLPLPSYLVAVAVGAFDYVDIRGMSVPGRVVAVKGSGRLAVEAARLTPPIVAALERYFGRRFPYEKLDLLAVPEFGAGAMENAGAVTFRDEILLLDAATVTGRQRQRLISTTAHELAHMWFGDLVTMEWWDDVWLNESFASWMGDKVTDQVAPQFQTPVRELLSTQRALQTDARPSTRAIRQAVDAFDNFDRLFDELAYDKGQAVLGMLETWLGPETFRRGILAYLTEHEWKNATAADLWRALSAASGKDIGAVASTFLDHAGVPLVRVEPLGEGRVRLSQRRFHTARMAAPEPFLWKIPVALAYSDGKKTYAQSFLLDEAEQTVTLEKTHDPAWVHPNAHETGYYRWSVPPAALEKLAAAAPLALDARERIGFVGNLSALLDAGECHGDDFVRMVGRFAEDRDPNVLTAVLGAIEKIHDTFAVQASQGPFTLWVRRILQPAFHRYGLARTRGEPEPVSLVRPTLLARLGAYGGEAQVLTWATATARTCLDHPDQVDPSLAGTALNLAARRGDDSLFSSYRTRFENAKTPAERSRYLTALGNFRSTLLVERALAYSQSGPLRPQELLVIPRSLGEDDALKERVWEWFKSARFQIERRLPAYAAASLPGIAACCAEGRIDEIRGAFLLFGKPAPGTAEEVAKVSDSIRDCAELRRRELASVGKALEQMAERP